MSSHQFNSEFLGLGIPKNFFQEDVVAANEVPAAGSGVVHITGSSHHTMPAPAKLIGQRRLAS